MIKIMLKFIYLTYLSNSLLELVKFFILIKFLNVRTSKVLYFMKFVI